MQLVAEKDYDRVAKIVPGFRNLIETAQSNGATVQVMRGNMDTGLKTESGEAVTANGVSLPKQKLIRVRVDDPSWRVTQLGYHELFHYRFDKSVKFKTAAQALVTGMSIDEALVSHIRDRYDSEKGPYTAVLGQYGDASEAAYWNEFCADLAGDLNRFDLAEDEFQRLRTRLAKVLGDDVLAPSEPSIRAEAERSQEIRDEGLRAETVEGTSVIHDVEELEDKTYRKEGEIVNKKGDPVVESDGTGSSRFSLTTYDESGRKVLRNWLDKAVKKKDLTREDADAIYDEMERIYNLAKQAKDSDQYEPFSEWSEAKVVVDSKGNPVFSVVKNNGEYVMNLDFSLVCKKRATLDAVFNELVKRGVAGNLILGEEQIVRVNDLIRSYGFETACALCFVDAKRYRQANVADTFVTLYNDVLRMIKPKNGKAIYNYHNFGNNAQVTPSEGGIDTLADADLDFTELDRFIAENKPENKKSRGSVDYQTAKYLRSHPEGRKLLLRGDFLSTAGFDAVAEQNEDIMKLYNSKKGTGGPKSAESNVQYLNEILKSRSFSRAKAYAVGGVRIQSFSDYIPRMVFDYAQMIADLSAKKLPAHSYTKESLYVMQFGLTGIKINMSLVPDVVEDGVAPGLDKDGHYVWKDGQSFGSLVGVKGSAEEGYQLALKIQADPQYGKNCGTIAVGISSEHIRAMMKDPAIRMIIPYHKSSISHLVAGMNNIAAFTDYTDVQNTRILDKETGKLRKLDPNRSGDKKLLRELEKVDFNKLMHEGVDPREAAERYVRKCEELGLTPKFDEFAYKTFDGVAAEENGRKAVDENYYKLLTDFAVYDESGAFTPQSDVTMTFPSEGSAFGSFDELMKQGLSEDAILEGKRDKDVPDIVNDIIAGLGPKTEDGSAREEGVQYSIAGEHGVEPMQRQGGPIDLAKFGLTAGEQNGDTRYSTSPEADAAYLNAEKNNDTETAQRMVDAAAYDAGYTRKVYRGAGQKHNVFDTNRGAGTTQYGPGTYFTDAYGLAEDWALERAHDGTDTGFVGEYYIKDQNMFNANSPVTEGPQWGALVNLLKEYGATDRDIRVAQNWGFVGIAKVLQDIGKVEPGKYAAYDWKNATLVNQILREVGYDGIVGDFYDSKQYVIFDPAQAKSADPFTYDDAGKVIPLSKRFNDRTDDIRYSISPELRKQLDELREDGLGAANAGEVNTDYDRLQAQSENFHDSGPAPARHTDVPKQDFEGRNIPKSASTVYGANGTTDSAAKQLEGMIASGELSFDTETDTRAVGLARRTLTGKGFDGALEQYRNNVNNGTASKDNVALGQQLLLQAMRDGNDEATAELLTLYTRNSTTVAQALQAQSMFRKLSPEGQLIGLRKAIEAINEKYGTNVELTEDEVGEYTRAGSQEEREKVHEKIVKRIAETLPRNFKAKFDAIRYLAMLGNPRTHIRNILGNALFQAPVIVKNRVGAVGELLANAVSGGKVERTKSLTGIKSQTLIKEAQEDFKKVKDHLGQINKYNENKTVTSEIEQSAPAFSNSNVVGKTLNTLAEGNSNLLELEDMAFKRYIYVQSLAGYLQANGIQSIAEAEKSINGRKVLVRAREYAAQEAMRNTFNDRNQASDAVSSLGKLYRSENKVARAAGYVVEGVVPFKRTPTNILVRALEYSPAGVLNGIYVLTKGVKGKNSTEITRGIDRLAAGVSGSALFALGMMLAAAGRIKGGEDDDEKQKNFDSLRRRQNYSIELDNGKSVTLDWLAPEAIPFFMGVEMYGAALEGGLSWEDLSKVAKNTTSPMLEMSMLQGLNDAFDNAAYAKNQGNSVLGSVLASALTSYVTQVFPTVLGQAERTAEDQRMTTYTDKNSSVPTDLQYTLGKVSQKVPHWDYNQIPFIDAWGRTTDTGSAPERAFNNMANPAYVSQVSRDPVEDELQRLYDATGESVLPERAAKKVKINKVEKNLTAEEYVTYATQLGQDRYNYVSAFIQSNSYAKLDDAARAKAIKEMYEYADKKAKSELFGQEPESDYSKITAALKEHNISPDVYTAAYARTSGLTSIKDKDGKSVNLSKSLRIMKEVYQIPGLSKDQIQYLAEALGAGKTVLGYSEKMVDNKLKAMENKYGKYNP